MSLVYVKTQSPRGGKRWYNRSYYIHSSKVCPTAIDLHTKMYTAFAEGDLRTLGEICTDGILESYKARIKLRKRGEVVKWELLKYNGTPKVVSDRAAIVPGTDGMVIRQAVVRIASRQRLTRYMGGKMVEGTGKEKDVCEYVVLQNTTLKWKNKGWQVWGTTKETTIEDLAKIWS
jgi:protein MBA1